MVGATYQQVVSPLSRSLATGLLVMALAYAIGNVSGAHLNPAITLAFAARRAFPWRKVPSYWLAQLAGALLAALMLRVVLGDVEHLGATFPGASVGAALVFETLLTCLLVMIVLGTATRHRVVGPNAAIATGGTIALCGLFARPISGVSLNPARSLAPALLSGTPIHLWIYILGPLLGALLGVVVTAVVHRHRHHDEPEAAGDGPSIGG